MRDTLSTLAIQLQVLLQIALLVSLPSLHLPATKVTVSPPHNKTFYLSYPQLHQFLSFSVWLPLVLELSGSILQASKQVSHAFSDSNKGNA